MRMPLARTASASALWIAVVVSTMPIRLTTWESTAMVECPCKKFIVMSASFLPTPGRESKLSYSETEQLKVSRILKSLLLDDDPSIVVIDARNDDKPRCSKA